MLHLKCFWFVQHWREHNPVLSPSFSGASFSGGTECHWRWLYVQFLAEVIQILGPSSLVEDAEDTAGLATVSQSPRTQGGEQWMQTAGEETQGNLVGIKEQKEKSLVNTRDTLLSLWRASILHERIKEGHLCKLCNTTRVAKNFFFVVY